MYLLSTGVVTGQHDSSATFWGGVYDLEIQTRPRFLTMHLPTKFHHHMFNHSEVIALTNKQTNP